MATETGTSSVRDRILAAAADLFYRQGYRATGINQVIAESGVAKASFYDHFPSKDDLLYAYVQEAARQEMNETASRVAALRDPRERFFVPLRMLRPWFEETDYRGCPFQNILAEAPPSDPRIRGAAREHRENLRVLLLQLARDMTATDPKRAKLDVDDLVATYQVLLEGAIALAVAYRDAWPVDQAIDVLNAKLDQPDRG